MSSSSGFIGGGGSHVQQLVAGTGITLSPTSGLGIVTINSSDGANVMLVDGGLCSTFRCGVSNSAYGSYAFSGGGQFNESNGNHSFIGGGLCNCVTACGAVLGGFGNNVSAPFSGAFGCNLNACNACTFYTNNQCVCGTLSANCFKVDGSVVGDLIPAIDNFYILGSCDFRWKDIRVGQGSVYITDTTCNTLEAALTVTCGALLVNGVSQMAVAGIRFNDGTTQTTASVLVNGTGCCSVVRCEVDNVGAGAYSFNGAGQCNKTCGNFGFIGSGFCNCATGSFSTISNGCCNSANCNFSSVINGYNTCATAPFAGAFGCNIIACNACTFYGNNFCSCGQINATTCINSSVLCGTTCITSPLICGTTSMCTPIMRATTACITGLTTNCAVCVGACGILTNYTPEIAFGSFSSSVTQCATNTATTTIMTYNSTEFANNIGLVGGSCLIACTSGIYDVQFSAQFDKASGGNSTETIDIWILKEGSNYEASTGSINITGTVATSKATPSWNYFVDLTVGQYIQFAWATTNTNIRLTAFPTTSPHTAIPSIAVTINKISNIP